jgi:gamma-glutamyltranspeptidase/glutathione hydrolase
MTRTRTENPLGAIAAGHRLTAEAGAEILAAGGNAVDACLAAAFASWVAESTLTGPGGGGFMLVHLARDRSTRVLDFYVAIPGLGGRAKAAEMESVEVAFTPESSQSFRIGHASCAVPGAPAGLERAHRAFGSLPWRRLIEPAIRLAEEGIELTEAQAYLHSILDPILRHTAEGRAVFGPRRGLRKGERLVMKDLAGTLEVLADRGADELYRGALGRALCRHIREHGGRITMRDLAEYRVIRRRPVRARYLGHEFDANPPPSSGGVLIGYGLRLLSELAPEGELGSAEAIAALVDVMREQARVRDRRFGTELNRGGLARRLYAERTVREALRRLRAGEPAVGERPGPDGTTHISVVDGRGNAAALTVSTGSGSGVVVPGTGIHLNNMLGEFDVDPAWRHPRPGMRLTSMMAPSLVLREDRPRLVLGSAGSLRLRGAIMQVIVNVVGHGLGVEEAIAAPRVHDEQGFVHCEGGHDAAALQRLEGLGYDLIRWRGRNLFFGGVSAVEARGDGTLAAAGDPRRGGHGIVVGA